MKKYIWLFLIFFVIFGWVGFYIYSSNNLSDKPSEEKMIDIRNKVEGYLINEKNYNKNEIFSIEAEYNPRFEGVDSAAYSVVVIFLDEKDVKYRYGVSDEEVYQMGFSGSKDNPIHAEQ